MTAQSQRVLFFFQAGTCYNDMCNLKKRTVFLVHVCVLNRQTKNVLVITTTATISAVSPPAAARVHLRYETSTHKPALLSSGGGMTRWFMFQDFKPQHCVWFTGWELKKKKTGKRIRLLMGSTEQQFQASDRKTGRKRLLILMEAFPPASEMTVTNCGQISI